MMEHTNHKPEDDLPQPAFGISELHRILSSTGLPLAEGVPEVHALLVLNMAVYGTALLGNRPDPRLHKVNIEKLLRGLETYLTQSEKLRDAGFPPPDLPEEFHSAVDKWASGIQHNIETLRGKHFRTQLLADFYPKALGAYGALFGEEPTLWENGNRNRTIESLTVRFTWQIIQEARAFTAERLLARPTVKAFEVELPKKWTTTRSSLRKSLANAKKSTEIVDLSRDLPFAMSGLKFDWEIWREFYRELPEQQPHLL